MIALKEQILDVLARLSTLSEAPAAGTLAAVAPPSSLPKEQRAESDRKAKTPKRHYSSTIPAGASLTAVDPDRPPPKERSLFDHYAWRFARLDLEAEAHRARVILLLAERDYERRVQPNAHTKALRSGALLGDNAEGNIAEEVQIRRVIEDYVGVPAIEVAIFEEQSEEWVRKARRIMGRDPDNGHPRPAFLDWSDDERRRQILSLKNRGYGQKRAADHLGVAKSTIQPYWPQEPATVAA